MVSNPMPHSSVSALDGFRQLGGVDELWALSRKASFSMRGLGANGHVHLPPNFSAFESVEQVVGLAASQNVRVLGASNYYDYDVYRDLAAHCRAHGVAPLFGLEIVSLVDDLVQAGVKINDPGNPGRLYICGKAITRFESPTPRAAQLLDFIRTSDRQRMAEMIQKLSAIFHARGADTQLTEDAVVDRVVARHGCARPAVYLQERHVAQAFQEALFQRTAPGERLAVLERVLGVASKAQPDDAVKIQGEIRSYLMKAGKAAFVQERFLSFAQARELILELGGIPCYPTLADGASPICPYEQTPQTAVANVQSLGVHMAELIPIRNAPHVLEAYVKAYRSAGIAVTAGTEHNTLDLLPMEPRCVGGEAISQELNDIFWEGACVTAAHQFLTLHGETGFVDAKGNPNAAYGDPHSRIAAFAALGNAVIGRYLERFDGQGSTK